MFTLQISNDSTNSLDRRSNREPIENLECQDLIDEFEAKDDKIVENEQAKKSASKKKQQSKQPIKTTQKKPKETTRSSQSNVQQRSGFDEGLTVDTILGATDAAGELMFLIKWYVVLCAI